MGDWKIELDALIRETTAFAKAVSYRTSRERPLSSAMVERITSKPLEFVSGSERDAIIRHVERFRAQQQRLIKEREECATSVLVKMRSSIR